MEQFQSLTDPDKLLSLSFWCDGKRSLAGALLLITVRRS